MSSFVSGAKDFLFGTDDVKPRAKDMTPGEFKNLRPTISQGIADVIRQGGGAEFTGPMVANVTGREQSILDQMNNMQSPQWQINPILQAMQQGQQQFGSSLEQMLQQISAQGGRGAGTDTSMQHLQQMLQGGQQNPMLEQAIQTATRPIEQRFQEEVVPGMRAQFTQAGQQVQGQGSSPFQMAAARASSGLADAIGDVSTRMTMADMETRRQQQMQAAQLMPAIEQAEQQFGLQQGELGLQGILQGQQVTQAGQETQLQGQLAGQEAELRQVMANLEAQALPRLVEQFGIDRGLEEFRRRQEQLMAALGLGGQATQATAVTLPGWQGQEGAVQSSLRKFGDSMSESSGESMGSGGGWMNLFSG